MQAAPAGRRALGAKFGLAGLSRVAARDYARVGRRQPGGWTSQ